MKKKPSGVNFSNVLRVASMRADPKISKKLLNLTVFSALLGYARVKAACRMLVKLTPDLTCLSPVLSKAQFKIEQNV